METKEKINEAKGVISHIKSELFDVIDKTKDEVVKIKLLQIIKENL